MSPAAPLLAGKVALVTGAGIGIGAAAAVALAQAGARIVVTSRDATRLTDVAARVEAAGGAVLPLALDVRDVAQIEGAIRGAVARFGRLDVVVNNAGLARHAPALDVTPDDWNAVMETNLRGAFFVSQAAAKVMRGSGGGCIVGLSSTFARAVVPERAVYGASKAALEHLTRSLAREWAPDRIRVNAIAPTTVITETRAHLFPTAESRSRRIAEIPLGRLGETADVVSALLFLVSDAGSFVTGQTLYVDGGYTLR